MKQLLLVIVLFFVFQQGNAQDEELLKASTIPDELTYAANAVVRSDYNEVVIEDLDKMIFRNKRIVTVLNKEGDYKTGASQYYSNDISIKKIEARIFDASGNEIKKFKKNDFEDVSAVSGGTMYSDNRLKYMNYTPIKYPYTVLFESEVSYNSTVFIPNWRPIEGYYASTENAEFKVVNNSSGQLKLKKQNFEAYGIENVSESHFKATHLKSIKPEAYSPSFTEFAPYMKAALTSFNMMGVEGSNQDWSDFGKWMDQNLINGTRYLTDQTIQEINNHVKAASSDIEKARLVYQYVQDKTRYISVQVGIGGWKPMLAKDVDRLGYGDCKALTNYTKALLDAVGVESYYTVIYGGRDISNIDHSFSSIQGNHVILSIPFEEDYTWLECTSQTVPFGYVANFTDDRDALVLTPDGGKIVHTKVYETTENLLDTSAEVNVDIEGNFNAAVTIKSRGSQYKSRYEKLFMTSENQNLSYKEDWDFINNLSINKIDFENDKEKIVFTEEVAASASRYASKTGDLLLLSPNFFNRITSAPPRYTRITIHF